jgi:DNA-binding CsgD family transcriptional regulator
MMNFDPTSLIAKAYDAALDDSKWRTWTADIMSQLGGNGVLACVIDARDQSLLRPIAFEANPKAFDDYLQGMHLHDPQVDIVSSFSQPVVYRNIPGERTLAKNKQDYLKWQRTVADFIHNLTVAIPIPDSDFRFGLCVHRSRSQGAIGNQPERLLRTALPELSRAVTLGFKHAEMLQDAFWHGVQEARQGQSVALIDERGRVIRLSEAASKLVGNGDGIDVTAGRLRVATPSEDGRLSAIVMRATRNEMPLSGAMSITRPSGRPRLFIVCYPLPRSSRMLAPAEAAALLVVTDPGPRPQDTAHIYREAFNLTPRESELASALMKGHSIESASALLGLTMSTARTHMRHLFTKTATNGQSSLIRLLARLI